MKLGKHWVEHIPLSDTPDEWIAVVNEISAGSHCKYRLDKSSGQLQLARALPRDVTFPANYGFVPHTRCAADDEEVDVFILSEEPLLPLTIVRARLIGGFMESPSDERVAEERLVAAACDDPTVENVRGLDDLDGGLRHHFELFVRSYKQNQRVDVTFDGWFDRDTALDKLRKGLKRARKRAAK